VALISLTSGRSFILEGESTLLHASGAAGIALPYSCKIGRCNSCKCKVISGETIPLLPETGLTEKELASGWILSCARTAIKDVLLEADDLTGVNIPQVKTLPCRIKKITPLARDVIQVNLRLPPSAQFDFIPGQYIEVIGPNGIRRSYSIANSSLENKELQLHIKYVPDGVLSHYWFKNAQVDDLLRLNGPLGTFFLRDTTNLDIVFFATGTGIAPILSMLGSLARIASWCKPRSVRLFWGSRTEENLYLDPSNVLNELEYVPVLSRPSSDWNGAIGHVQNVYLSSPRDLGQLAVYACGSDEMIRSSRGLLFDQGLPPNRFFSDAFVSTSTE
jgi:CDP-4-dehydro-6-deoxyglucose reductase